MSGALASPCINICQLNAEDLCTGCWRSLDEIAAWGSLSPQDRAAVMARLPARALTQSRISKASDPT